MLVFFQKPDLVRFRQQRGFEIPFNSTRILIRRIIFVVVLCVLSCLNSHACFGSMVVVYNNNANVNTGYFNDAGTSGQRIFDEFQLSAGANDFNRVIWTGVYATRNDVPDNFTMNIYDDNGGVPGNVVQSVAIGNQLIQTQTGTLNVGGGFDIFTYEASFGNINLTADETYWISLVNDVGEGWAWLTDTSQGTIAYSPNGSNGMFNTQSAMDFQLVSTLPEPGSFVMLSLLLGPILARRRRTA
ncbi:MAG: hypothetical protein AAF939_03045 [Planctomycetota bacterium]